MRWAFWRGRPSTASDPHRPLPDDVGLPTTPRPPAAPRDPDEDDQPPAEPPARTPGAVPAHTTPQYDPPLAAGTDLDRTDLADAGPHLVRLVRAVLDGTAGDGPTVDDRVLAVAATGALAARLPALSGAGVFDEPEDELLHAYADVLVGRATRRRTAAPVDRDDLLAVAHLAAAAAAVGAADEPALLRLAGVPAKTQVGAAALLLAQTADDGAAAPEQLAAEVRGLFGAPG